MSVIYVLLPVAILLAVAAVTAFIWAVCRGQFDDLDTPAVRVLFDEEEPMKKAAKNVHLRDPHELASWVNEIVELEPATPQPGPASLPDSAAGGSGIGE